ncbi:MAG: ABC transporter permease [Polyangiaceae bacterium]
MGYPLYFAIRYLRSKKREQVSVGTLLATIGVTLGVAALSIVMSVTGGFHEQFREKVLGVNAHVLVLKYPADFREYRDVMKKVSGVKGVVGVAPFWINPLMVTHGDRTATGVLVKGVDPVLVGQVLDLPKQIVEGSLSGLRKDGAKPPERSYDATLHVPKDDVDPFDAPREADAGKTSVLDAIEKQIAEDEAKRRAAGESATPPIPFEMRALFGSDAPDPKPAVGATPPKSKTAGVGSDPDLFGDVTPKGGFASELPSEDVLPDSVDPDPCKSPEQVAKLPGVVVGRTLSKQLSANVGDCVQITSPTVGISYGTSNRPPVAKQFRVIAVFEAGFDQYDSKLVYTDLYEAQTFYDYGDSVTGVEMKVDDIDHAKRISREIDAMLGNLVYHTMDWEDLNHGLFTALLIQQILMSVILALIIVVATFTVIATLIMLVLEKQKEIALLKSLGARDDAVLRIFLYQGGLIGIVGTTAGLLLGYAGCRALAAWAFPLDPKVYFISKLPVNIRLTEFAITGGFAIATCLVATIFPALYAARLRPADGLRAK